MTALISSQDLGRTFGHGPERVDALHGVTLSVQAGEHVAIVGKSGAGKSTLLQLIGALDRGYTGALQIAGEELRDLNDRDLSQLRNQQIGFVFQAFNLLANLSVGDNLTLPAQFGSTLTTSEAERRAKELLDQVGLANKWNKRPLTLSGGERQRVAIARALLLRPPILIGDEPTGSLDAETADGVMELLEQVRRDSGSTLILVTHDPTVAVRADRVVELAAGKVVGDTQKGSA